MPFSMMRPTPPPSASVLSVRRCFLARCSVMRWDFSSPFSSSSMDSQLLDIGYTHHPIINCVEAVWSKARQG